MYVTRCFGVENKILVTFAIFEKFEAFSRPFLVFFFSNARILLNLSFLLFLRYLLLAFSGSKKNPCYFCAFNFAGFGGPFLAFSLSKSRFYFNCLFLQLLWYLQVIVSQKFRAHHFSCENCEKNLLANFCS